jgi:hypothetical protein
MVFLSNSFDREKQKTPADAGAWGERRLALPKKQFAASVCHPNIVPR